MSRGADRSEDRGVASPRSLDRRAEEDRCEQNGCHHRHDGDGHDLRREELGREPHVRHHERDLAARERAPLQRRGINATTTKSGTDPLAEDERSYACDQEEHRLGVEEEADIRLHGDARDEDGDERVLHAAEQMLDAVLLGIARELLEVHRRQEHAACVGAHEGREAPLPGEEGERARGAESELESHRFVVVELRQEVREVRGQNVARRQCRHEERDGLAEEEENADGVHLSTAQHPVERREDEQSDDVIDSRDRHDQLRRLRRQDPRVLEEDGGDAERGRREHGRHQCPRKGAELWVEHGEDEVDQDARHEDADERDEGPASRIPNEGRELGFKAGFREQEPDAHTARHLEGGVQVEPGVVEGVLHQVFDARNIGEEDSDQDPTDRI